MDTGEEEEARVHLSPIAKWESRISMEFSYVLSPLSVINLLRIYGNPIYSKKKILIILAKLVITVYTLSYYSYLNWITSFTLKISLYCVCEREREQNDIMTMAEF